MVVLGPRRVVHDVLLNHTPAPTMCARICLSEPDDAESRRFARESVTPESVTVHRLCTSSYERRRQSAAKVQYSSWSRPSRWLLRAQGF